MADPQMVPEMELWYVMVYEIAEPSIPSEITKEGYSKFYSKIDSLHNHDNIIQLSHHSTELYYKSYSISC